MTARTKAKTDDGRSWLVGAETIAPRGVEWLWNKRVPLRAVTLLAGIGGVAKSQITLERTAAETRGELAGSKPHNVLVISAEDTAAEVIVPRLIAVRADLARVKLLQQGRDLLLPRDLENGRLKELVAEAACRLVVIDPIAAFLDAEKMDSHKTSDVRRMLKHLAAIAESRGVAFVCVAHFHKGEVTNVIHQISGSAGFGDAARSAFAVGTDPNWDGPDEDAPGVFIHVKNNWGPKQPPMKFHVEDVVLDQRDGDGNQIETSRVVWDGEDSTIHADQVFGKRKAEPGPERADAARFIQEALAGGPMLVKEFQAAAAAHAISPTTLKRARQDLGIRAYQVRGKDGKADAWMLALPMQDSSSTAPGGLAD